MRLFRKYKERKPKGLPNTEAHNKAKALAQSDSTLDYLTMYSAFLAGATEEQAIEASRKLAP